VWLVLAMLLLVAVPLLYILSIGPVAAVYGGDLPPGGRTFYWPVIYVCGNNQFAGHCLIWYLHLWFERPPRGAVAS
jgi:hypothetical protein